MRTGSWKVRRSEKDHGASRTNGRIRWCLAVGRGTGAFLWGTPLHPLLIDREHFVKRARRLEHITIAWNSVEAAVAILSGLLAGSVALVGFGLDSFIEVTSGVALLWRLHRDGSVASRERAEHLSLRIVGSCFLLLAAYVVVDSLDALITGRAPERSLPGMILPSRLSQSQCRARKRGTGSRCQTN